MRLLKIVEYVMTAIIAVAIVAVLACYYIPLLLGWQPYAVISGSMSMTNVTDSDREYYEEAYGIDTLYAYEVGCLAYVREADFDEIEVGDTVTFAVSESTVVTHMVVAIDEENQVLTTHGISNAVGLNETVEYTNIVGKASAISVPYAGYILSCATTTSARILMITYIVLFVIVLVANNFLDQIRDKEEEESTPADKTET